MKGSLWRGRLILAAKITLGGGLLTWLAYSGRLHLTRLATVPVNWQLLILIVLVGVSMAIPAVRWWWLLRIQALHLPLWTVVKLTWSGYLAALVLPGAASGDLAKTYLILRQRESGRARAFSTILADRFLGLHSLFCLGALSALWMIQEGEERVRAFQWIAATILIPLASMTAGLAALLSPKTRTLLFRMLPTAWHEAWDESFGLYSSKLPHLIGCFGLSLVSSGMTVAAFSVAACLLGQSVQWATASLAGPLIVVSNCLPFTPGGIGLAEVVSGELFGQLGSTGGAEIMILTRICSAGFSLLGLGSFLKA